MTVKITQKDVLTNLLKEQWLSAYQMQQMVHSSSADRTMREIRKNPPLGYAVVSRRKDVPEGYGRCFEFHLEEIK